MRYRNSQREEDIRTRHQFRQGRNSLYMLELLGVFVEVWWRLCLTSSGCKFAKIMTRKLRRPSGENTRGRGKGLGADCVVLEVLQSGRTGDVQWR